MDSRSSHNAYKLELTGPCHKVLASSRFPTGCARVQNRIVGLRGVH